MFKVKPTKGEHHGRKESFENYEINGKLINNKNK